MDTTASSSPLNSRSLLSEANSLISPCQYRFSKPDDQGWHNQADAQSLSQLEKPTYANYSKELAS
jgi:hypothetical protein